MTTPGSTVVQASFAQERLWFLNRFEPGSAFYNVPAASRLRGPVDLAALRRTLDEIVRRHEALRTTIAEREGQPVQVIAPALALPFPVVERRDLPPAEREREAARLAAEEAQLPFDLERGPLLRCTLVRFAADDALLLVTLHHIVSDAWSLGIFFGEISALYEGFARRRPVELPELPVQYADFAQWQREWLRGEVLERFLAFWRGQLAGAPAVLELPTDHPRPEVQTFRGALTHFALPAALAGALSALGQRLGATLFMTLLAVYAALLERYTGQRDIVIGSPIANRNRAEIEGVIGFFVNTLVVRVELAAEASFVELVERVADGTLAGYDHQDLPFEKLVAELQPQRDLGRNPLFQVMFSLQNTPTLAANMVSADPRMAEVGTGTAKFDLALLMGESAGTVTGAAEYNTDLFDAVTIERLVEHFLNLLGSAAADPGRRLSELEISSGAERQQLLALARGAAAPFPRAACLHHLFEEQAARTPAAVAASFAGAALTYRELDARANRLARRLRALGLGPGSCAGIALERSPTMLVGILGVLKAGAACVPLDPAYPAPRIAFMLADSRAAVVLSEERIAERLPASAARVLLLGSEAAGPQEGAGALDGDGEDGSAEALGLPGGATADDLLYVIYTSGSTGQPKGVAMGHRALVNLVWWQNRRSRLPPGACTLQFTSLSFDVSFQEIFSTLSTGGRLALASEETRKDPVELLRRLAEERVERLFLAPVALQQLAETALRSALVPDALREVVAAGEQLKISAEISGFLDRLEGAVLDNQYGPSESHIVSGFVLHGPAAAWPALPPIGRAIANASIHLLDAELRPVPAGVPGELYIGGEALARGYLDRPDLTAERFVPDCCGGEPGARLYRSGDLGRLLPGPQGDIQFLGRRDHQVKIRGFRIELAEVEIHLKRHPAVRAAAVAAREGGPAGRRLVAYLVGGAGEPPGAGEAPSASHLRSFLLRELPEHMVPSAFVWLAAMPLLPSGKVDRRALPPPGQERPELKPAFVAPRTPLEAQLSEIWQEVLRVERVGMEDNFFDLGGHSLLATQVASRVRDRFAVEIPLRRLFEAPTVAGLAVSLVESRADEERLDDIDALLAELEGLSDDDARAIISRTA